jgi:tetratricopeptide (TPR) repeat protein
MRVLLFSLGSLMMFAVHTFSQPVSQPDNIGPAPTWMESLSPMPDWWSKVNVTFTNDLPGSNYVFYIKESEDQIDRLVGKGISPVQERRELIKYISLFEASGLPSPSQNEELELRAGELYSRLGEHRRAAKVFAELAKNNPDHWGPLQALAHEYERAGEKEYALQVYNYLDGLIRKQGAYEMIGPALAGDEIAILKGKAPDCTLKKPAWWDEYINPPDWLTNTASVLPPITSFRDGEMFIWATFSKQPANPNRARACTALLDFPATTGFEREDALTLLALAYDAAGDHHRAIVTAFEYVNRFPGDREGCARKLKFISREFEKLGESENAQEIQNAIPCFSGEAK